MNDPRFLSLQIVNAAVVEINEELDDKVELAHGEEALLYGKDAPLDSLALVSLIVLLEEKAHDTFGRTVTIADDRAMSQFRSPFRSVGSLTDYVCALVAA
ncbi:MAG: acyl carrier protein [Fimbriimonas sp.]